MVKILADSTGSGLAVEPVRYSVLIDNFRKILLQKPVDLLALTHLSFEEDGITYCMSVKSFQIFCEFDVQQRSLALFTDTSHVIMFSGENAMLVTLDDWTKELPAWQTQVSQACGSQSRRLLSYSENASQQSVI